jgi:hypothetical protein
MVTKKIDSAWRKELPPIFSPFPNVAALPRITAMVYPGPFNPFSGAGEPLFMIAPGAIRGSMMNGDAGQLLNGTDAGARIVLKACMDQTMVTKFPVDGQLKAANQPEADLGQGDIIYVKLSIPRKTTVDIYCNRQSLNVMGIGESPF